MLTSLKEDDDINTSDDADAEVPFTQATLPSQGFNGTYRRSDRTQRNYGNLYGVMNLIGNLLIV